MKSFLSVLIIAVTVMAMSSEAEAGRRCCVVQSCATQCVVTTCEVKVKKVKKCKCKVVRDNCCVTVYQTATAWTQSTPTPVAEAEATQAAPAVTEEPLAPMVPSDKL